MTMSPTNINHNWSVRIIQLLYFAGVRDLCIAPGSRSAPLTIAAEIFVNNQPETQDPLILHGHFDERGLGFFALGIAKAKIRPVAVITTSGTAVANLLPATIEANQTTVPLILLTADRPEELLDCGANQAIRQTKLFGDHVQSTLNLPTPTEALNPDDLTSTLEPLFAMLSQGPIHINCPFRDPLYPNNLNELNQVTHIKNPFTDDPFTTPYFDLDKATNQLHSIPLAPGLVVVGRVNYEEALTILDWAEQQGHILVADISSSLRLLEHPCLLPYPELMLASISGQHWFNQANQVIQFGGRLVSKRLNSWLATRDGHFIISTGNHYLDPNKKAMQIQCELKLACDNLKHISVLDPPPSQITTAIEGLISQNFSTSFSEISANISISQSLSENTSVFIGNSLSIRWMDLLASRNNMMLPTFTNRGASGIDGLIATATGINEAGKDVLVVLGDTSALHDLNSLSLASRCSTSVCILVINNQGGSIFNLLPAAQYPEINKRWFKCQHPWSFEQAAKMFQIEYHHISDNDGLKDQIEASRKRRGATLIECHFEPDHATDIFKDFMKQVCLL